MKLKKDKVILEITKEFENKLFRIKYMKKIIILILNNIIRSKKIIYNIKFIMKKHISK